MSEEELENNLGVIASSGTYQFRQEVGKDNEDVGDAEVLPLEAHVLVRQGPVAQLVDGIAGVGDDLPGKDNEDVDIIGQFGVGFYSAFMAADHISVEQVQQALGFRLELLLSHSLFSSRKSRSGDPCFFHAYYEG